MVKYNFDGNHFRDVLKRIAPGESQEKIAEKIGTKQSRISAWVNGEMPTANFLIQIALEYNVSIDELLGIEETRNKVAADPSPRRILSMIHSLCEHDYISLNTVTVDQNMAPADEYPDIQEKDVLAIIPEHKLLCSLLPVYDYLRRMPSVLLRDPTIEKWLLTLPETPLKNLPPELCDLLQV